MFNPEEFEKELKKSSERVPADSLEALFNTQIQVNDIAGPHLIRLLQGGWPDAFTHALFVPAGNGDLIIKLNFTPEEKEEFEFALTQLMGQPIELDTNPN